MRLIDADALRKYFEVPHELKCGIQAGMDEYALKCIDEQPTIDAVEVRHGEWVKGTDGLYHCSRCEKTAPYLDAFDGVIQYWENLNYCHNCGARMDGERREG